MSFVVLMVALIPLSYLFTTSIIQAGQSKNQQTALSIAEKWAETLANATPPVYASTGAVIVDHAEPPAGPAATPATPATVTAASNNKALDTVTSVAVSQIGDFAPPGTGAQMTPQTAYVITGTSPNTVSNEITYTSITGSTLNCPSTCSTSTNVMVTGDSVTQTEVSQSTELRGGTTYGLQAEYEWATVQNTGIVTDAIAGSSVGAALPQSTIQLSSVSNLLTATSTSPQSLKVPTSLGTETVTYTGVSTSPTIEVTGVTGGTSGATLSSGNATQTPKPNLCTSGSPSLLKLTVTVSWGPNADANNVQDSVILNYPPSGVQTLGFIALQFSGDSAATDAQGDLWSERVTAIPVTLSSSALPASLTLYPDQYGCAFAQVPPGNYTVAVANATSGTPAGSNYGTPSFVANATGTVTSNVWSPPTTEPQGGTPSIPVSIGAVTRVDTSYSANYPGYDQGAVVNFSYPSSSSVEDGVTCPGVGQLVCVTSGESGSSGAAEVTWLNSTTNAWSTATLPTLSGGNLLTRLTSVSCTTNACIGVGYGTTGAVILHATTGSSPALSADTVPTAGSPASAVTSLTNVFCLTGVTDCVATGTNSTGQGVALAGSIGSAAGSDTWTADTTPANLTSLSSLQCNNTSSGCVAVATTTTANAPVIVSGPAGGGTWAAGTLTGVTVSALTQVVCPNTANCVAIGTGVIGSAGTTPVVLSDTVSGGTGIGTAGSTATWTADTYSPTSTTVTSLSSVVCPVTSTPKCLVAGYGTSGGTTGALFLYGAPAGPLAAEFPKVGATPISSITQVTCPVSTQCQFIGVSSGSPEIFTGTINPSTATADTWANDTLPSTGGTVSSLSQVTCQALNDCLITAAGTSASGPPAGFLFETTTGSTWSNVTLPSTDSGLLYFDAVSCTLTSGTCSAVGATPSSAVILSSNAGPGGTWSDGTPSGLAGYHPTGIPIEINNSGLSPSPYVNAVTAGYSGAITQLPLLYPFQAGYSMWAGDCSAETNSYNVAQATTIPGGTSGVTAGMSSPVVPLGIFSLAVTHKSGSNIGLPDVAATVSLTAATSACAADVYSLQATGADGLSRTEVPYGTYSLSVAGTSVGTLVVNGNTVVFTPTSGSPTTYTLPTPVAVSV